MVSFILTELDMDFNPVVSVVLARVEPITISDLLTQLIAFEQRWDLYYGSSSSSRSSTNMASRGRCGGHNHRGHGQQYMNRDQGNFNSPGSGHRARAGGTPNKPKIKIKE